MTRWDSATAARVSAPEEIQVVTTRRDGSFRAPRIIWVVAVGERVFIRSTNGRGADWFRAAIATGRGRLVVSGTAHDVVFVEAEVTHLPDIDMAYRHKYGRYAAIVDHLLETGPRSATLEVLPEPTPTWEN